MAPRIVRPALIVVMCSIAAGASWSRERVVTNETRRAEEARPSALPVVRPNDNRLAAGTRSGDTLALRLEVTMARWYPEADDGPYVEAPAFAEEGGAPQIPGPLLRVRQGSIVDVTIRNTLTDSTLWVFGLGSRPMATNDSVAVAPGQSHRFVFAAGAPGTFMYRARAGAVDWDIREREQLAGAFVIDSLDARPDDRIFVINVWGEPIDSTRYRNAVAVNGKSWPYTERITAAMGDSVRWRWVNASIRNHPMHLHGFYFRIDRRGTMSGDTLLAPEHRRLAVTESMLRFHTMSIVWSPDRPGNWLFHCHLSFHVVPATRLEPPVDHDRHDDLSQDVNKHMAGLIVGMEVRPSPSWVEPERREPQRLRLVVQEGPRRGNAKRAMGFVLQRDAHAPAPDSVEIPGSLLVLERDRPADVTVVNRMKEPTAVHWHGIELESYSDGVAGWSGHGARVAPMIAPGDSFVARLTTPRAGTFMYHTHLSDIDQVTSGLYGGIVVTEPDERFDPTRDHVFVVGWDGHREPVRTLVNGDSLPGRLAFARGVPQRLRFINIGPANFARFHLMRGATHVPWRRLAKDGADLPPSQSTVAARPFRLDVGEVADMEFTPMEPGAYELQAWRGQVLLRKWDVSVR